MAALSSACRSGSKTSPDLKADIERGLAAAAGSFGMKVNAVVAFAQVIFAGYLRTGIRW